MYLICCSLRLSSGVTVTIARSLIPDEVSEISYHEMKNFAWDLLSWRGVVTKSFSLLALPYSLGFVYLVVRIECIDIAILYVFSTWSGVRSS